MLGAFLVSQAHVSDVSEIGDDQFVKQEWLSAAYIISRCMYLLCPLVVCPSKNQLSVVIWLGIVGNGVLRCIRHFNDYSPKVMGLTRWTKLHHYCHAQSVAAIGIYMRVNGWPMTAKCLN